MIAFTGNRGHGKDTAADAVQATHRLSFAERIKRACQVEFGLTDEQLYVIKDVIIPRFNMTPRDIFKKYGDAMRRAFGEEHYANMLHFDITSKELKNVVVTDVRYDFEAKMLRDLGFVIIKITRPDVIVNDSHSSEQHISEKYVDVVIVNDSDISSLHNKVKDFVNLVQTQIQFVNYLKNNK